MRANPRTLCAAAALVAALAGAGETHAAPKPAKFMAEVSGSQTISWSEPRHMTYYDCYHRYWTSGMGQERISFRSRRPVKVMATKPSSVVLLKYGTFSRFEPSRTFGIPVHSNVVRNGYWAGGSDPGECGGPTRSEVDKGEHCGEVKHDWMAQMEWRGRSVLLELEDRTVNPLVRSSYEDCPIVMPSNALIPLSNNDLTEISGRANVADLFNRRRKRIVVNAGETFTDQRKMEFGGVQTA